MDARNSNGTSKVETPAITGTPATVEMPGRAMAPTTGTSAIVGMPGTAMAPAKWKHQQ
jgi:hypothetical protein